MCGYVSVWVCMYVSVSVSLESHHLSLSNYVSASV